MSNFQKTVRIMENPTLPTNWLAAATPQGTSPDGTARAIENCKGYSWIIKKSNNSTNSGNLGTCSGKRLRRWLNDPQMIIISRLAGLRFCQSFFHLHNTKTKNCYPCYNVIEMLPFIKTPNLQLFSSETPMYRAFAGSWRLEQPPTKLSLTSNIVGGGLDVSGRLLEPPTGLSPFIYRCLRDF